MEYELGDHAPKVIPMPYHYSLVNYILDQRDDVEDQTDHNGGRNEDERPETIAVFKLTRLRRDGFLPEQVLVLQLVLLVNYYH